MLKTYEKAQCMKCGNAVTQDEKKCKCGGRNVVMGEKYKLENGKVTCGCGSDQFKFVSHLNMSPVYSKTYRCSNCCNSIGIQTYSESYY